MKTFNVTATFYELPAAHAEQTAKGEGSDLSVAVSRALKEIAQRRHVKGRRIKRFRLDVVEISNGADEEK